jgi:hypothetical protein
MAHVLTSFKVQSSRQAVSDTLGDMLVTMNGKSPHFVNFMVGILKNLGIQYFEIVGMFQSPHIPVSTMEGMLAQEMELNEHDLRYAWMQSIKQQIGHKEQDAQDKEAEWFFAFCTKLGFPYSCIIRMLHDRQDA